MVYGRIGKDALEALLCRYYLNSEVWTGIPRYDECWEHAQNIIRRHRNGGFVYNGKATGLAVDYLSLSAAPTRCSCPEDRSPGRTRFCGACLTTRRTQPYGGTAFLCNAPVKDAGTAPLSEGFCDPSWYGLGNGWGCMHARQQFAEKFGFSNGVSHDGRTYLWITETAGADISNKDYADFFCGYLPIKFTNLACNPDGTTCRNGKTPSTGSTARACSLWYARSIIPTRACPSSASPTCI